MSEDKSIKDHSFNAGLNGELPFDTKLLSDAVIELNISRKNIGIYPPGHIQIIRSIDRTFEILTRLFEIRPELTLGVAKDTLLVGQNYLDRKNPVYRDFALSLNQLGIAAVTFMRGLTTEELTRFHRVLTTRSDEITAAGGLVKLMADSSLEHIRIVPLNYNGFHVTEEREIFKPGTANGDRPGTDLWQDFITHLSSGTLGGQGQGVSIRDQEHIDPADLARLLNERKLEAGAAIESYDRIISSHIRGAAEKKQLTRDQSKSLSNLNMLLKDLKPELRKQFLSVAFERVSSRSGAGIEEIVGGLTDDMVIEMLTQANAEGREISPTLAGLIAKLAGSRTQAPAADDGPTAILQEQMEKLFDREKYEDYVSDNYQTMLKQMMETAQIAAASFPLDDHLKTLEDSHLDSQIGRAVLAFMEENLEEEDYKELAGKLVALMPGFLETGNFELLFDISEALRRHMTDKPFQGTRESAGEALKMFTDPEFIKKVLHAFEVWMRDKGQEAAGFIKALGPDTIPGLMDIYGRDEPLAGKHVLFNLLCLFGEPALREAHKRLRDPRNHLVKLLLFIRRAGSPASIPHVRPLISHQDPQVMLEALSTLLKFKDREAPPLLRNAIRSDDPDISSKAVSLAGQYRVADVTEDVLALIKRVILFETDHAFNMEIIKVLGEIGDPRAVPDLENLARAKWSLYPESLKGMKEALFESLGRYQRESIVNLLQIGEQSNNDTIKRACKKLMERKS